MPSCLSKFATPRLAIAVERTEALPPPQSSVVTKTLPIASTVVSNIPTEFDFDHPHRPGRGKCRHSGEATRFLRLVGQFMRRREWEEIERLSAGVEVEHDVGHRRADSRVK